MWREVILRGYQITRAQSCASNMLDRSVRTRITYVCRTRFGSASRACATRKVGRGSAKDSGRARRA